MATTTKEYTGNGSNYINGATTAQCDFTFPYLKQTDVKVSLNGTTLATTKYTFPSSTSIQFASGTETTTQEANGAPKTGVTILIYRDTDVDSAKAVYASGSSIRAIDLNNNKDQSLYFEQEVGDTANPKNFVTSAQISDGTSLSAADKTKLDTIEANAKDDQTGAEIKTLYEAESNTNAFTDAEKTKLGTVETNAKDDQTAAEIKSLYESNSQTNAFTDAEKTKLSTVEANAKDDQTATEIKSLYESNSDTNAFTDADHTKLDGIEANAINASNAAITNKLPLAGGTLTGNLKLADNERLDLGNGSDLRIYYDNANNVNLNRIDSYQDLVIRNGSSEVMGRFNIDGSVRLCYDSVTRLETTSSGVLVSGDINATGNINTSTNIYISNIAPQLFLVDTNNDSDFALQNINGSFIVKDTTNSANRLVIDSTGNVQIPNDTGKLQLGADQDLQIYHNGTDSVIRDDGTGNLNLQTLNSNVNVYVNTNELAASFITNGAVELYHNNNKKLETTSTGTKVIDSDTTTHLTVETSSGIAGYLWGGGNDQIALLTSQGDSEFAVRGVKNAQTELFYDNSKKLETTSNGILVYNSGLVFQTTASGTNTFGNIQIPNDTGKIKLGASQDLEIYHDGSNSRVQHGGTGFLIVQADDLRLRANATGENYLRGISNGAVELYYDNSKKLETTSIGVNVGTGGDLTSHIGNCNRLAILGDSTNPALLHIRGGSPSLFFDKSGATDHGKIYQDGQDLSFYNNTPASPLTEAFVIKSTSDIQIPNDDKKLQIGASQDLELYHDSSVSQSFIDNSTSYLRIRSNQFLLQNGAGDHNYIAVHNNEQGLEFFYDNVKKLETSAAGIKIDSYLELFHYSGTNFIKPNNGSLDIITPGSNANIARFIPGGAVELWHNASKKLETTSTGATVTTTSAANSIKNITTSTSAPSGGSDGDLWFTYVA